VREVNPEVRWLACQGCLGRVVRKTLKEYSTKERRTIRELGQVAEPLWVYRTKLDKPLGTDND